MTGMGNNVTLIGQDIATSFHKRYLKFEFIMGMDKNKSQKTFSDGSTTLVLEHFRATVNINYQGGNGLPECECTIYNLEDKWTNQLTTLGQYQRQTHTYGTYLKIYASMDNGSSGSAFSEDKPVYDKVFEGGVTVAYVDLGSTPDIVFHVSAMSAAGLNLIPNKSLSFKGKVPVEQVMEAILANYNAQLPYKDGMGKLNFKNYGVTATLNNPNYHGDLIEQIRSCTQDTKSRFSFKDQVCYIFPENNSINDYERTQDQKSGKNVGPVSSSASTITSTNASPQQMSADHGMIGYPAYADNGITVRCVFNRTIRFGEEVFVVSTYKPACGLWKYMISLQHQLSCYVTNGPWYTSIGLSKISPKEKEKGRSS